MSFSSLSYYNASLTQQISALTASTMHTAHASSLPSCPSIVFLNTYPHIFPIHHPWVHLYPSSYPHPLPICLPSTITQAPIHPLNGY